VVAGQLIDAERRVVLPQELVDLVVHPRPVAQLERVAVAARQLAEELLEPLEVHVPTRRKLPEDRAELSAEPLREREEVPEASRRILQFDHVRDEAAPLHSEAEARGRGTAPHVERRLFRQVIEGVVQLDGVEVVRVPVEHLRGLQAFGIIAAQPVLIVPAGRADAELHDCEEMRTGRSACPPLKINGV